MYAVVTGATSGIGKQFCKIFKENNIDIIAVSKDEKKLKLLYKDDITIKCDLNNEKDVNNLMEKLNKYEISIFINNAGFGKFGEFNQSNIEEEIEMINVNIVALHKLTKYIYNRMLELDKGYILNVASSAGLMPAGPLMATYYATKSYVTSLTMSIYEENRRKKNNIHISALCPGPVNTNFNKIAGVEFNISSLTSEKVVNYTLKKMKKNKPIIVPGIKIKLGLFIQRIFSIKFISKISYHIQSKKYN